jgi:hypothetical protein
MGECPNFFYFIIEQRFHVRQEHLQESPATFSETLDQCQAVDPSPPTSVRKAPPSQRHEYSKRVGECFDCFGSSIAQLLSSEPVGSFIEDL